MANEITGTPNLTTQQAPVSGNFNSILAQVKTGNEQLIQQLVNALQGQTFNRASLVQDGSGLARLPLPDLGAQTQNLTSLLLRTTQPVTTENFNLRVQNANIVINDGQPQLRLDGQLTATNGSPVQRFVTDIPVSANNTPQAQGGANSGVTIQLTAQQFQQLDEVVQNTLSQRNLSATSTNLNENIRPLLPQNLQNINLNTQNNLNIRVVSFTTPEGQVINIPQANTGTVNPQPQVQTQLQQQTQLPTPSVITGKVEVIPDANQTLIRTQFGNFRIEGINILPNASTVSFAVDGEALLQTPLPSATSANNLLNLNPTNVQTLRLALESPDSILSAIFRSVLASQTGAAPMLARLFPNPDDRQAFLQGLMFMSGAAKAAPEDWIGEDGVVVGKVPEMSSGMEKLKEIFVTMQNFANKGEVVQNPQWNSYVVPFFDGTKLSYATIQVQRDAPDGKGGQDPNAKRKFIVEMEQSDVGQLAIEGMYSNTAGKVKNLDIILKTEESFSPEIQQELEVLYNETATAYGFTGSLIFEKFNHSAQTPYTDISKILGDGIVI